MKTVVIVKFEFEKQNESTLLTIVALVVHQDSNAVKIDKFAGQYKLKSQVFPTATLVEEIRPVFTKENEC